MKTKMEDHLSPTMSDEYKKIWKKHNFKIIYGELKTFNSFESYEEYLLKNKQDIEKYTVEMDKRINNKR